MLSAGGKGLGCGGTLFCSPSLCYLSPLPPKQRRKLIRHFPPILSSLYKASNRSGDMERVESTGFAALSINISYYREAELICVSLKDQTTEDPRKCLEHNLISLLSPE